MNSGVLIGVGLVLAATLSAALGDAVTKMLALNLSPALVLFWVGALVCLFASFANTLTHRPILAGSWQTSRPGLTALRAVLGVLSVACFFQAFAALPLIEVFVFIGFTPVISAILSRPVLGESVSRSGWVSLLLGACGILLLFSGWGWSLGWGHTMALGGAAFGAASLVLIRKIAVTENNPFAQVFYPHMALMLCVFPFAAAERDVLMITDLGLVAVLSGLVLITRTLIIYGFTLLRAHVAGMLMNVQFIWVFIFGLVIFQEMPEPTTLKGAGLIILSSAFLLVQQASGQLREAGMTKAALAPAD